MGRGAARGVRRVPRADRRRRGQPGGGEADETPADSASACARTGEELGGRLRFLVGKPGLDGHSNGAEQIAVRARDAGFEVIYQGIRLTPAQIVAAAVEEDVHVVGLSVLSGSHLQVVPGGARGPAGGRVWTTSRSWSAGSSPTATPRRLREQGVAAGVHAEGLRAHRDHGRASSTSIRAAHGLPDEKVPEPA